MPKPRIKCASRSPRTAATRLSATLAMVGLATFLVGAACLWQPELPDGKEPFRSAAGVMLIVAAIVQWRVAAAAWAAPLPTPWHGWLFWQAFVAGGGACYVAALVLGPARGAMFFFASMLALWFTGLVVLMTASGEALASLPRVLRGRAARRTARLGWIAVAIAASAEGVLRVVDLVGIYQEPTEVASFDRTSTLPTVAAERRVALLGLAAIADDRARWIASVDRLGLGLESRPIGTERSRLVDYSHELAAGASQWQPGLVLAFVPAIEDVSPDDCAHGIFDWRSLRLAQIASGWMSSQRDATTISSVAKSNGDWSRRGGDLSACRTPSDAATRRNWRRQIERLDALAAHCVSQGAQLAIVLVPADFQVNGALSQTLARRKGYKPGELDLDLPQRRMAAYAAERKLPLVDLLPILKNCAQPAFDRCTGRLSAEGSALAERTLCGWLTSRLATSLPMTAQVGPSPSP